MDANHFQPMHIMHMLNGAITVACRDCDTRVAVAFAIANGWQHVETEINPDQTSLDCMCPDCVECWHEENASQIDDQTNDIN
jgi:hypothetical protein